MNRRTPSDAHPLVSVFTALKNARRSPDQIPPTDSPYFTDLPRIRTAMITTFSDHLAKTDSIPDSLRHIGFTTKRSPEILKYYSALPQSQFSLYSAIMICRHSISILWLDEHPTSLSLVLVCLLRCVDLQLFPPVRFLFSQAVDRAVAIPVFDWTINNLYVDVANRFPPGANLSAFAGIGLRSHSSTFSESALSLLCSLPPSMSTLGSSIADLLPHCRMLNPRALDILQRLSLADHSQPVCACYSVVADAFFCELERRCRFERFAVNGAVFQPPPRTQNLPFDFSFFVGERPYFPNGFTNLPSAYFAELPRCTDLIEEPAMELVATLSDFFLTSHRMCAAIFVRTYMAKHANRSVDNISFGTIAVLLLLIKQAQVGVLCDSRIASCEIPAIDSDEHILFCEGTLHEVAASLRRWMLDLFIMKDPSLLIDRLRVCRSKPFLLVEWMGWILARQPRVPMACFQSETVLTEVLAVAKLLQEMQWSREVVIARNIAFQFLFELAKLQVFGQSQFVGGFFIYIFELEISERILSLIQSMCVNLNEMNCLAAFTFFRKALVALHNRGGDKEAEVSASISETVYRIAEVNLNVINLFGQLFPTMMDCLAVFRPRRLLVAALDLFALSPLDVLTPDNIAVISGLVKSEFLDDPVIYHRILMLMSYSDRFMRYSEFLIDRPAPLQLLMACYGSSAFIGAILTILKNLTNASAHNVVQCHKGNLDIIFLEFLAKESRSAEIRYDGFVISFSIDLRMQNELMIPLFIEMALYVSSHAVAARCIELIIGGNQTVTRILSTVLGRMTQLPSRRAPCCTLSRLHSLSGLDGSQLSKTFTLAFSFRLDLMLFRADNPSVDLLTITNSDDTTFFAISLTMRSKWGLLLTYIHDQRKTILPISENLICNNWHFIALVFRFPASGGTELILETYKDHDWDSKPPTSRLPVFDFASSPLIVEMGRTVVNGNHRSAVFGEIADIQFFDRPLDQREILSLTTGQKRPQAIALSYSAPEPFLKSLQLYLTNPTMAADFWRADQVPAKAVLTLTDAFFFEQQLTNRAVDSLVQILTKVATPSLYFFFLSLMPRAEDRSSCFENLVFNFWLWQNAGWDQFRIILRHWATELTYEYQDLLKQPNFFSASFAIFEKKILPLREKAPDVYRLFVLLLKRLARISLSHANAEVLFSVCARAPDQEAALTYLDIIKDLAQFVPEEIALQCQSLLISLITRLCDPPVAHAVFTVFCSIPVLDPMVFIPIFRLCGDLNVFLSQILTECESRPELCEGASILALHTKQKAFGAFARLCQSVSGISGVQLRSSWYLWPLLLAISSEMEDAHGIIRCLGNLSCQSAEDVISISHLLLFFEARLEHNHPESLILTYLRHVWSKATNADVIEALPSSGIGSFRF
jgi:hypothetical protein